MEAGARARKKNLAGSFGQSSADCVSVQYKEQYTSL